MAKLQFDRSINLTLKYKEQIEIPKDEYWKVSGFFDQLAKINNVGTMPFLGQGNQPYAFIQLTFGGGVVINGPVIITGIAFKIID